MLVIKTLEDLERARQSGRAKGEIIDRVEQGFREIHKALEPETDLGEFSLENHGPIGVWVEGTKDLSALGILGSIEDNWPEFVTRVTMENGSRYYRVGLLLDNDFMVLIYIPLEAAGPEMLFWLEENAEDGGGDEYDGATCPKSF